MKNRFAKRTDACQSRIVSELRDAHIQVVPTNFGDDYPDLMVGAFGKWILLECKNEKESSLDRGQLQFLVDAKGPVAVVSNTDEALKALDGGGIATWHKAKVAEWLKLNPGQQTLSLTKFRALGMLGAQVEKQREKPGTNGSERSTDTSLIRR